MKPIKYEKNIFKTDKDNFITIINNLNKKRNKFIGNKFDKEYNNILY